MGMVYSVTGVNFRICSNKHKNREEMPFLIIREDINWEKKILSVEKLLSVVGKDWNYAVHDKYYEINTYKIFWTVMFMHKI